MFKRALVLSLILVFGSLPAFAKKGGNGADRGGGASVEQDFRVYGQEAIELIKLWRAQGLVPAILSEESLNLEAVASKVHSVRVVAVDKVLILQEDSGPVERDAINSISEQKIWVYKKAWLEMDYVRSLSLVFHEYLGTMGLDRDYLYSTPFAERVSKTLNLDTFMSEFRALLVREQQYLASMIAARQGLASSSLVSLRETEEFRKCKLYDPSKDNRELLAECFDVINGLLRATKTNNVFAAADFSLYGENIGCTPKTRNTLVYLFKNYKNKPICRQLERIEQTLTYLQTLTRMEPEQEAIMAALNALMAAQVHKERKELIVSTVEKMTAVYESKRASNRSFTRQWMEELAAQCPAGMEGTAYCVVPKVLDEMIVRIPPMLDQMAAEYRRESSVVIQGLAEYQE